jgi:hypothetical protein
MGTVCTVRPASRLCLAGSDEIQGARRLRASSHPRWAVSSGLERKRESRPTGIHSHRSSLHIARLWLSGAAQESNLPSLGLPDLTGFEDQRCSSGIPERLQSVARKCVWVAPRRGGGALRWSRRPGTSRRAFAMSVASPVAAATQSDTPVQARRFCTFARPTKRGARSAYGSRPDQRGDPGRDLGF